MHQPYSPYIAQRETLDQGFSAGWGFHFPPCEEYVVDCHAHTNFTGNSHQFRELLDRWFAYTEAYRQQKIVLFVRTREQMLTMHELQTTDNRVQWMFYAEPDAPDLSIIKEAQALGACGLKLHCNRIMKGEVPLEAWYQSEWKKIFSYLEEVQLPIIWHVTQRVSYSPYHGGGENAYFSEGQKKGVFVTNEMLLEQICKILAQHPHLNIIGAHQLYLGLTRLQQLLDTYPNLYLDTSVGFFLRWCDTLYEEDRLKYYQFVMKYPDRILFGTDTDLSPEGIGEYQKEAFCAHLRFIHQLRLPYEQLQMLCYQNAERLLHIPPSSAARKFNTRP